MLAPELTDKEANLLEVLLDRYSHDDDDIMDFSEVDGFVTAIACSPVPMPESEWMVGLWAKRKWPAKITEPHKRQLLDLLSTLYQAVAIRLAEYPDEYGPVFNYSEHDGKEVYIVDEWCFGFLRGVGLQHQSWEAMIPHLADELEPIRQFTNDEGWKRLDEMPDQEFQWWQSKIRPLVLSLYQRIHIDHDTAIATLH